MVRLAGECELSVTRCDDIYSAATELARHRGRSLMVAGQFRQLMTENGEFCALARRNGVPCCGLLDGTTHVERDKVLAAVRLGVRLAGEMADIRRFLEDRMAAEGSRGEEADEDGFSGEQFRATDEELKALLRQETDG